VHRLAKFHELEKVHSQIRDEGIVNFWSKKKGQNIKEKKRKKKIKEKKKLSGAIKVSSGMTVPLEASGGPYRAT
jgi:hypothetical protein